MRQQNTSTLIVFLSSFFATKTRLPNYRKTSAAIRMARISIFQEAGVLMSYERTNPIVTSTSTTWTRFLKAPNLLTYRQAAHEI
jgi:hypothetical protein